MEFENFFLLFYSSFPRPLQPEAETNEPSAILPSKFGVEGDHEEIHTETQSMIIDNALRLNVDVDIKTGKPVKAEVHAVDSWVHDEPADGPRSNTDEEGSLYRINYYQLQFINQII